MAQRLVGNFGFTNAQRSFDGIDAHYGQGTWDVTAMAARSDQGVFNMNGNPELNVDVQYLAYTKSDWQERFLWRVFAIGYHDGRTGITKTDNRPLPVRQADHQNIRVGTYGGDFLTAIPAGPGQFDFVGWGALQNGQWGEQGHRAGAADIEGGYQLAHVASTPWLRGGWFRSSGDNNPSDNKHGTFFELLPTPRVYARFPFWNLMDLKDEFVQLIDRPKREWELRSDLYWLQLTSGKDLWYQGGGAYDNKVFGFRGGLAGDLPLSPALPISVQTGTLRLIWTSEGIILTRGARAWPAASIRKAATPSCFSRVGFPLGHAAQTLSAPSHRSVADCAILEQG